MVWGGILYIITMIAFPIVDGERLNTTKIIMGIPLWIIVGLTIGYLLKDHKKSKPKPKAAPKRKR